MAVRQDAVQARGAPAEPSAGSSSVELTDLDFHLFSEGTHTRIYEKLGAHLTARAGVPGTSFAVWAPNAGAVSVIGDFNAWDNGRTPLAAGPSGIWSSFVPGLGAGTVYKYHVVSSDGRYRFDKSDPYGFYHEVPPRTGSVVWDLSYDWQDQRWLAERGRRNALDAPISIYEVHLGSWMRVPEEAAEEQAALGKR